ncbi:hypothetical protein DRN74_02535 [Candidatus Micrarchaeota archaeon]|nr:MAG: hypothetical protein DRN74_02535 [Candidatus Micrarchaeota archaeon]
MFSRHIYNSWKEKQIAKYKEITAELEKLNLLEDASKKTMLDIGIGPAWLEEYLRKKGYNFKEIVGIDIDESIKKVKGINYIISSKPALKKTFDFVFCIDALHLVDYDITAFARREGILVVSVPLRFSDELAKLNKIRVLIKKEIGDKEKDLLVVAERK